MPRAFRLQHLVDRRGMAIETGVLRHATIPRLNLNGFVKVLKRESQRMKKAIVGLGHPFADGVMRQVAIAANGHVPMTRLLPGVVMALHHMAVSAACRIVTQVAVSLAITKGKQPDAEKNAQHDRGQD
jgi:hypothetical protein